MIEPDRRLAQLAGGEGRGVGGRATIICRPMKPVALTKALRATVNYSCWEYNIVQLYGMVCVYRIVFVID
jgi:hypothetical protein